MVPIGLVVIPPRTTSYVMNVLLLLVLVSFRFFGIFFMFVKCGSKMGYLFLGSGAQPIVSDDEEIVLSVNGEIYNHKQLRNDLKGEHSFKTESDCEVIMHMVSCVC